MAIILVKSLIANESNTVFSPKALDRFIHPANRISSSCEQHDSIVVQYQLDARARLVSLHFFHSILCPISITKFLIQCLMFAASLLHGVLHGVLL